MEKEISIAVLSDIHSNHVALEACVDELDRREVQHILFLGDYVSNCAYPEKTMAVIYDLAKRKKCWFIRGNREELLIRHADGADDGWKMPSMGTGAILYTYQNLESSDIEFFRKMPISGYMELEGFQRFAYCHGHMTDANNIIDEENAAEIFRAGNVNLVLCGHTHFPGKWQYGKGTVINVGSVGTPMNKEGLAEFVILHGSERGWEEEFVTVSYDRDKTVEEMEESGLIAQSLVFGRIIRDLLVNRVDRWGEVLTLAREKYLADAGDSAGAGIPDEYFDLASDEIGIQ